MPRNVFVSYRREDGAASAGRLGDRLARELGDGRVFMDVDGIPLGADFVKLLTEKVATCDVLLAVIGAQWAGLRDDSGNRRLDDPDDFVRVEIRAALKRDIPVIPILLDGTKIPSASSLPEDIRPLSFRNGLDLRHASFQKDLDRLVRELTALPSPPEPSITSRPHISRYAVVAAVIFIGLGSFLVLPRLLSKQSSNTLVPISCEQEKNLHSENVMSPTEIVFSNSGAIAVRIYWLNQVGARVLYGELGSGQNLKQQTFVTHPWVVADKQDRCIGIYMPSSTPSDVLLR
jgi:hypothetical protein